MTSSRRGRGTCSSASRAREGARVSSPPFWLCVGLDSQKTKKTRGRRSSTARIEPVRGQTVPHLFSPLVKKTKRIKETKESLDSQKTKKTRGRRSSTARIEPVRGQTVPHLFSPLVKKTK